MAYTYYYTDALNYISSLVPRSAESDKAAFIANLAINEIWKRYDFRETLKFLPPFYLVPGAQDHSSPAVVIPADFLSLRQAYIVRLNSSPIWRSQLTCMKDLTLTPFVSLPGQICYQPGTASFRVFPRVPVNIGAPNYVVQGEYKKRSPKVAPDTLSSTLLPFDDIYFYNLIEVFKWAAWSAVGDQRAGGVQSNGNGAIYTGQYGAAMDAIDRMAEEEGLDLGEVNIAPKEPLANVSTGPGFGGTYNRVFGW